jgi:hypothetical protein
MGRKREIGNQVTVEVSGTVIGMTPFGCLVMVDTDWIYSVGTDESGVVLHAHDSKIQGPTFTAKVGQIYEVDDNDFTGGRRRYCVFYDNQYDLLRLMNLDNGAQLMDNPDVLLNRDDVSVTLVYDPEEES